MKKQMHRDVWMGLMLLALCAWILILSIKIPGQAAYLPIALSSVMALCAGLITLKGVRLSEEGAGKKFSLKEYKIAFIFMGFIFVYYLMFRFVSYWIATPIFLIFTQKYLKVKSWKVNLIITVCYLILSFIMFVVILKLPIYKVGVLGRYFRLG